ncbi:hypothetical protein PHMEG_00015683 [Phytophthora megakarya]|uniref:Uncharacterized protein n=1 Tax=Phytophthora megakarya TaxID=4795 RepID=A0A225W0T9_9STRA|nr:hypothetical protein PHMEG_00015683 [Phytophthora megakarya]
MVKINTCGGYLNLSAGSSASSSKSTSKRKRQSQSPAKTHGQSLPDALMEIQWIRESSDKCRPDGDLLRRRADTVGDLLEPYPVVWDQLRLDLQALILYGINYEDVLGWLGDDRSVHACFHQGPLLEMLLRMMFWNSSTALRGQSTCHDVILSLLVLNWILFWRATSNQPLEPVPDEPLDDDIEPPDHDALTDQNWTLEGEADDGHEDDDDALDNSPSKTARAGTKRRRIAPLEQKNRSKREYQRATYNVPANAKVRSWVYYGVRMKWCEKSLYSPFGQSFGFPATTPNRHDMKIPRRRFSDYYQEYRAIIQEAPWREMWNR